MSGNGKIEWYLARDGQQHGPLSQVELDKFIQLGHLRPADLLWRVGFDDWQAAAEVFPLRPPPQPTTAERPAEPRGPAPSSVREDLDRAGDRAGDRSGQDATPADRAPAFDPGNQPHDQARRSSEQAPTPEAANASAAPVSSQGARQSSTPGQVNVGPSLGAPAAVTQRPTQPADLQRADNPAIGSDAGQNSQQPQINPSEPRFDVTPARTTEQAFAEDSSDTYLDDDEPPTRSGWLLVAAALFVAVIVGAAGLFAYNNEKLISAYIDDLTSGKTESAVAVIKAPETASREPAGQTSSASETTAPAQPTAVIEKTPISPAAPPSQSLPELPLLKSKVWQFAQREFGDWTEKRLVELRRLSAESKSKEETNQYLVESFVRFRRQNATVALASSPESLAEIARAFVESLRALTAKGPQPCYAYISNGESTPELSKLYFEPDVGPKLEAQMLAIMKAVVDGKTSTPQARQAPTEADFNKLSTELGKRGWTAKDLKLFSDPNALSQAEPKLVCRLVTEWFAAQTQLNDQKTRDLLIAASLRPVIGG